MEISMDVPVVDPAESAAQGKKRMREFDIAGYEEAVSHLREAIAADPEHVSAHAALAETYAYWGFRLELNGEEAQSYYDLAHEFAEAALNKAPQSAESHRAVAVALRRGAKANAERRGMHALKAVELGPETADNWYEYWRAFGYDPSDVAIFRAIELDPEFFAAHHDLAVVLYENGQIDDAIKMFHRALKINPKNSLAYQNLAMVLESKGLRDLARQAMRKAQQIRPDDAFVKQGIRFLEESHGSQAS